MWLFDDCLIDSYFLMILWWMIHTSWCINIYTKSTGQIFGDLRLTFLMEIDAQTWRSCCRPKGDHLWASRKTRAELPLGCRRFAASAPISSLEIWDSRPTADTSLTSRDASLGCFVHPSRGGGKLRDAPPMPFCLAPGRSMDQELELFQAEKEPRDEFPSIIVWGSYKKTSRFRKIMFYEKVRYGCLQLEKKPGFGLFDRRSFHVIAAPCRLKASHGVFWTHQIHSNSSKGVKHTPF